MMKGWIISALVTSSIALAWAAPGGHIGQHLIAESTKGHHHEKDYYAHPKYKYGYGVKDGKTSDVKTAAEWREGSVVKGHYSLQEPDGSWRTVNYVADKNGYRAVVHRTPNHHGAHHLG